MLSGKFNGSLLRPEDSNAYVKAKAKEKEGVATFKSASPFLGGVTLRPDPGQFSLSFSEYARRRRNTEHMERFCYWRFTRTRKKLARLVVSTGQSTRASSAGIAS